jgi:hypothetical protein
VLCPFYGTTAAVRYTHQKNTGGIQMGILLLAVATVLYLPLYVIFGLTKKYK